MFEVYVHVPFCLRRCGYCDFNTYTARDLGGGASRGNYAALAIRQMRIIRDWQIRHGIEEPAASSVFFGGGTPTILPANDLATMLDGVRQVWGIAPGAEITTEANPDTVDAEYINQLAQAGFTRISLGMQSAVGHVLHTLDRTHSPANVTAAVRAARQAGLRSSVDLIYGTPGESLDDWRTSVQAAIDLGVRHISAYALTVEPTTKMGRRIAAGNLPKPDDDDEAAKYELADDMFTRAGLSWYEISNWAAPGECSTHNLGYWHNEDWAGIGPGAHSHYQAASIPTRTVGAGQPTNAKSTRTNQHSNFKSPVPYSSTSVPLRAWDITHPRWWAEHVNANQVPWQGSEVLTRQQDVEEQVMLGLRLSEGLDIARLEERFGCRFERPALSQLSDDGLIELHSGRMIPTLRGRLLNDMLIETVMNHCTLSSMTSTIL